MFMRSRRHFAERALSLVIRVKLLGDEVLFGVGVIGTVMIVVGVRKRYRGLSTKGQTEKETETFPQYCWIHRARIIGGSYRCSISQMRPRGKRREIRHHL